MMKAPEVAAKIFAKNCAKPLDYETRLGHIAPFCQTGLPRNYAKYERA